MAARLGRDTALDVFRGACVVSMTFGHLAAGTLPFQLTHSIPWYDGASGFVLLAGLVIGIIQRRKCDTHGPEAGRRALGRRFGLLYLNHVGLVILGLLVGSATLSAWYLPDASSEGGWPIALTRALTLQLNPPGVDILSMYTLLLVLAALAVAALSKGRLVIVAVVSLVLYAAAQIVPSVTTLRGYAAVPEAGFNWGAWQLIFISALLVGWHWQAGLKRAVLRWQAAAWALGAAAALAVLGVASQETFSDWFFNKNNAGPGWVLMAWAVFGVAYWALSKVPTLVGSRFVAPLEVIGRRSLDSFVLMTCALLVVPALVGGVPSGNQAIVIAFGSLVMMIVWAVVRDLRDRRFAGRQRDAIAVPLVAEGT